ncbi:L-ribulose-5-phosphate 4-epimerase AraD [Mariniplasma anaerobium]|uniref:L-ribulose-5-phosphate 4-epimerase n=1 Tax=Mariniplasma anaerobium TaxID=2735436 RepID=A0A7U9TH47_9MOLU|nr:L-ribulose-5-phosphate 4-epimerase AraD [Mariniplasma anaerobium]BCR35687.1 L-ribulose-5-phosphate 4-epimerase [Mariniplasma anaerobium]
MIKDTKIKVLEANLYLPKHDLVKFTWGNVSERDLDTGYVVIKPSGVSYDNMKADDMVVLDLNGKIIEGSLNPSSDTKTHLEVYKAFPEVNGICHVHSTHATAYAQAGKPIRALGTTHADYFYGDVSCLRVLTKEEIDEDYERHTGLVIVDHFKGSKILENPAILLEGHGVFTFGKDAKDSVFHASVLEEVAKMNVLTETINPEVKQMPSYLKDKHYLRKHGKDAYYGQGKKK